MALTKCEDCGHDVSTAAAACPNCGMPVNAVASPGPSQPTAPPAVVIAPPQQPVAPPKKRHTKLKVAAFIVVGLAIIGALSSHNSKKSNSSVDAASAASAAASVPITGRVSGALQDRTFCLGCGELTKFIHVDRIWCGWQGDQVIIHVRIRNSSVEHVTVSWHPSYTVAGGGSHGTGLTSIQSSGLDAGASRGIYVKQSPKGVAAGSRISSCKPALSDVQSG